MKQCAILVAKKDFSFQYQGKRKCIVHVTCGQRFWVTSSECMQKRTNYVTIDREGKGALSNGYRFTPEQITELFDIQ